MTEIIIEKTLSKENPNHVKFWTRAGAYLLDGIIIGVIITALNAVNIKLYKSFLIYLIFALVAILYKPVMESKYYATLGKMILNIKVTDQNYNKINFSTSFIRSLILILPSILYIPFYYFAFNNPDLESVNDFLVFAQRFVLEYPLVNLISYLSFLLFAVDTIVLLTDSSKSKLSLHDRIAKTYVVYDKK